MVWLPRKIEESACSRSLRISGSVRREQPMGIWKNVIKSDLKEKDFSKDLARVKNA